MTGPDLNRHDPLTAEERELAKLLGGRLDKAPPPAVDAAVLAAARAAVLDGGSQDAAPPAAPDTPTPRLQHRRPRWPAVFGVAASVVFAVGLAWQLRPEPPQAPARIEAAPAPASAATDSTAPPARRAQSDEAADVSAAMQADQRPAAEPAARAEAPRQARRPPEPSLVAEPAPVSPPVDAKPAPRERAAAPAPPLPAPSAVPAPAPSAARADAFAAAPAEAMEADATTSRTADVESSSRTARSLRAAPATGQPNPSASAQRTQGAPLSAEAVQNAVLADAQLTRRQWLRRIRQRRDAGDVDVARASLERYLFQYPETRLPRDLQPLLAD